MRLFVPSTIASFRDSYYPEYDVRIPVSVGSNHLDSADVGIFRGRKGPRWSPKPVYHLKPTGVGDFVPFFTGESGTLYKSASNRDYGFHVGGYRCFFSGTVDYDVSFWTTGENTFFSVRGWQLSATFYHDNGSTSNSGRIVKMGFSVIRRSDGSLEGLSSLNSCGMELNPLVHSMLASVMPTLDSYLGYFFHGTRYEVREEEIRLNRLGRELMHPFLSSLCNASQHDFKINHTGSYSALRYAYPAEHVSSYYGISTPSDPLKEDLMDEGYPLTGAASYWHNVGVQHAFLDACENLPKLNDNSISNILEIGSFMYNLIVNHRVEIPKSLTDAWLSYRYSYNTTKMDVEEAVRFINRSADRLLQTKGVKTYGSYTQECLGTVATYRCCLEVREKHVDTMRNLWLHLVKYGLDPDLYVLWDMIPYSFIVDWFLPVGDVLNAIDASRIYTTENYDFKSIIYSVSYDSGFVGPYNCKVYRRWVEGAPPKINGLYWFEKSNVSDKVIGYRTLDAASLIIGKRRK